MKQYPHIEGIDYPNRTEFRIVRKIKDPLFGKEYIVYYGFTEVDYRGTITGGITGCLIEHNKPLVFKVYKNRLKNKRFRKYEQQKLICLDECRTLIKKIKENNFKLKTKYI